MRRALLAGLLLVACDRGPSDATAKDRAWHAPARHEAPAVPQSAHVPSPSGWCEAYVVEWSDDVSQVILEFDGGACGSGAVTAYGKVPRLRLRWLDPTTLEVQHAAGVRIERNASGEVVQCGGPHRRVRLVLEPG